MNIQPGLIAISLLAALTAGACSASSTTSPAHTSLAVTPGPNTTTTPAVPAANGSAGIPATAANRALCKLVKIQLGVDRTDPMTAKEAGLVLLNAALKDGISSPALKADVSAWALALSTDLDQGVTSGGGEGSALRKVAAHCAQIGVRIP